MIQMEGASAYYNQGIPYDGYNTPISGSMYLHNQQPACVYARNNNNGGYGGQSMSVVEQSMQGIPNNGGHMHHGLSQTAMQHMNSNSQVQMANTTPAHMQSPHQQMAAVVSHMQMTTPPPAHQSQGSTSMSPDVDDSGVHSQQKGQSSNLQFPWMKTTKSHAAQWKAQWPGTLLFFFNLPVFSKTS